jgi:hypothetical protein
MAKLKLKIKKICKIRLIKLIKNLVTNWWVGGGQIVIPMPEAASLRAAGKNKTENVFTRILIVTAKI